MTGERSADSGGRRGLPRSARLAISLALIAAVLYFVDIDAMLAAVRRFSPIYLVPAVVLVFLDRWLVVYKWQVLLRARSIALRFYRLFLVYTTAMLSGYILPSTVGGDIFRVYSLRDDGVDTATLTASVVVERLLGFVSMLAVSVAAVVLGALLLSDRALPLATLATGVAILVVGSALVLVLFRSRFVSEIAERWASDASRPRLFRKLAEVFLLSRNYDASGRVISKVFLLSLLRQFLPILTVVVLALAFSLDASLVELLAVVPLIFLGSRLPVSVNGIGVQEGLYVALFAIVGVSPSDALVLSLAFRLLVLASLLPFALHLINHRPPAAAAD